MYPNDLTEPFEPTSEAIGTIPEAKLAPSPVKKSRTRLIVLVIVLLAGVWISIPYIQFFVNFAVSFPQEIKRIEVLVQDFLTAMSSKDTDAAYEMMSTEGDAQTQRSNIDTLLQGKNYVVFEGFREISLKDINISQYGAYKYAEVSGDVFYDGGFVGDFSGKLVKEGEGWRIQWLTVNAPVEKFVNAK